MKKFCEFLREHTMKIFSFKKKKIKLSTKEQEESNENAKICYTCKEKFENKSLKDKKNSKVRDYCHYAGEYIGAADSIYNLKYSVSNGSNYGYHFIIKKLAEEFEKKICLFGGKY